MKVHSERYPTSRQNVPSRPNMGTLPLSNAEFRLKTSVEAPVEMEQYNSSLGLGRVHVLFYTDSNVESVISSVQGFSPTQFNEPPSNREKKVLRRSLTECIHN